jgi:hypothetical protein
MLEVGEQIKESDHHIFLSPSNKLLMTRIIQIFLKV